MLILGLMQAVQVDAGRNKMTKKTEHQDNNDVGKHENLLNRRVAVSIPEMSALTGLSEGLLYAKANQGSLPGCRRIGKRFLVHIETFERYLETGMGEERGS